ncbi:hypothetical protein [Streptomyces sp. CBMA152]|uniref:hypothetical protein n=1 Tax=Streptomyces sp. CBMA152 TaxID=1896312 RepID=UPI00166032EB|nr:hypothetical protein [Streptomyces sp. CBMA152]MBD0744397.1 hypothetical protein [Streptomyces sp. CBMA152]
MSTGLAHSALRGHRPAVWFARMRDHGLIPAEVTYRITWLALPVCLAVAVVTSALAALFASLRFSLLRPARALDEASAGRRGLGWLRGPLGAVAVAGACTLSVALSKQSADRAAQGIRRRPTAPAPRAARRRPRWCSAR